MYLKQSELFWGLNQNFIRSLTAGATKQNYQPDETVFSAEDAANYFYVLIQGRIRLQLNGSGTGVYTSERIGEAFGWSALIGRETYSASCVCEKQTVLLRFGKQEICRLLDQDAESAAIFFRQLAGALGKRLMQLYQVI